MSQKVKTRIGEVRSTVADSYQLVVHRCDNRLVVSVNGVTVYDKYYDFNPHLNDVVDITSNLLPPPHKTKVVVKGFNGATAPGQYNPWEFEYRINKGSSMVLQNHASSNGQGDSNEQVFDAEHEIAR